MSENLIKKSCKELNLTYKQLGELIGYSEASLKTIVSKGAISENLTKSIELLKENIELKNKLSEVETLKNTLKNLLDLK